MYHHFQTDQNHRFCWLELKAELTVHSKRRLPSLLWHSSVLLPFGITLFAQEELQIFPNQQFLQIAAKPPKASLQKGGGWISPVTPLVLTLRRADCKTDQKPTATSPVCHNGGTMGTAQPALPCKRSCLGKLLPNLHSEMAKHGFLFSFPAIIIN